MADRNIVVRDNGRVIPHTVVGDRIVFGACANPFADHSTPSEFQPCDRCEQHVHVDDLGFKPERFDRWWWCLLPVSWALALLDRAAMQEGEPEPYGAYCNWCFGPGYEPESGK